MSKKSQKEAVIEEVLLTIPLFHKYQDVAIPNLSKQQLENIKTNIANGIINGLIEYSKDINNHAEVKSYARSMVMNHLKKARELNGGISYSSGTSSSNNPTTSPAREKTAKVAPKGVNTDLLPEELKELAKSLVCQN